MLHEILSFWTIVLLEPTTKGQSHYTLDFFYKMIHFALKILIQHWYMVFFISHEFCLSLWNGSEPLGDEALGCLLSTGQSH
jgi:hypothetical protein